VRHSAKRPRPRPLLLPPTTPCQPPCPRLATFLTPLAPVPAAQPAGALFLARRGSLLRSDGDGHFGSDASDAEAAAAAPSPRVENSRRRFVRRSTGLVHSFAHRGLARQLGPPSLGRQLLNTSTDRDSGAASGDVELRSAPRVIRGVSGGVGGGRCGTETGSASAANTPRSGVGEGGGSGGPAAPSPFGSLSPTPSLLRHPGLAMATGSAAAGIGAAGPLARASSTALSRGVRGGLGGGSDSGAAPGSGRSSQGVGVGEQRASPAAQRADVGAASGAIARLSDVASANQGGGGWQEGEAGGGRAGWDDGLGPGGGELDQPRAGGGDEAAGGGGGGGGDLQEELAALGPLIQRWVAWGWRAGLGGCAPQGQAD
jgi:hypothetical protein